MTSTPIHLSVVSFYSPKHILSHSILVMAGKVLQAPGGDWYVWTSLKSANTCSLSVAQWIFTSNLHLEWHGAQWRHTRPAHEIFHHDCYHVSTRVLRAIGWSSNCLPSDGAGAKQQRLYFVESQREETHEDHNVALGKLSQTSPHSSPVGPELLAQRQRRSLFTSQSAIGIRMKAIRPSITRMMGSEPVTLK